MVFKEFSSPTKKEDKEVIDKEDKAFGYGVLIGIVVSVLIWAYFSDIPTYYPAQQKKLDQMQNICKSHNTKLKSYTSDKFTCISGATFEIDD